MGKNKSGASKEAVVEDLAGIIHDELWRKACLGERMTLGIGIGFDLERRLALRILRRLKRSTGLIFAEEVRSNQRGRL